MERHDEALRIIEGAAQKFPETYQILSNYGAALIQVKRYEEAIAVLLKAKEQIDDFSILFNLGVASDNLVRLAVSVPS